MLFNIFNALLVQSLLAFTLLSVNIFTTTNAETTENCSTNPFPAQNANIPATLLGQFALCPYNPLFPTTISKMVQFYVFYNDGTSQLVTASELTKILKVAVRCFFICHGFAGEGNPNRDDWMTVISKVLCKYGIVVMIDWGQSGMSHCNYAFLRTYGVEAIGDYLGKILIDSKIGMNKTHCAGHSLGAHICGRAGLLAKFGRITALDPAGPMYGSNDGLFPVPNVFKSTLTPDCAYWVEAFHTDLVCLGMKERVGHADYYVNGGKSQPGCGLDCICDHCFACVLWYCSFSCSLTAYNYGTEEIGSTYSFIDGIPSPCYSGKYTIITNTVASRFEAP